jgi:adenylate cyclase
MNARLERKLRLLSGIVAAGIVAGIAFSAAMDRSLIVGLLISLMLGGIELFVMEGPMLVWLSGLSFTTNLIIRSAIYAAIIIILQWFQVGEAIAGLPRATSSKTFWYGFI